MNAHCPICHKEHIPGVPPEPRLVPRTITVNLTESEAMELAHLLDFCANEIPVEFHAESESARRLEESCGMKWGRVLPRVNPIDEELERIASNVLGRQGLL